MPRSAVYVLGCEGSIEAPQQRGAGHMSSVPAHSVQAMQGCHTPGEHNTSGLYGVIYAGSAGAL